MNRVSFNGSLRAFWHVFSWFIYLFEQLFVYALHYFLEFPRQHTFVLSARETFSHLDSRGSAPSDNPDVATILAVAVFSEEKLMLAKS